MKIKRYIIDSLVSIEIGGEITNPSELFLIGHMEQQIKNKIKSHTIEVYISKKSLKHILDRHGVEIITDMPNIISKPEKVTSNHTKRNNSFIFCKIIDKPKGVVIEITKTPDMNRAVSAFPIDPRTYKKMVNISGGSAPKDGSPSFATPQDEEKSS